MEYIEVLLVITSMIIIYIPVSVLILMFFMNRID